MDSKATCHRALTATAFHRCNRDDLPHGSPAPCERLANRLQTMLTDFRPVRLEDRVAWRATDGRFPYRERLFFRSNFGLQVAQRRPQVAVTTALNMSNDCTRTWQLVWASTATFRTSPVPSG